MSLIRNLPILCTAALLMSCGTIGSVIGNDAPQSKTVELTRQQVTKSGLAVVHLYFGSADRRGIYYHAIADNNGTATYGKEARSIVSLRGGLVITSYSLGNDLQSVDPNAQDPIQNQFPVGAWPNAIERRYHLPGEGLNGKVVDVQCTYSQLDTGTVVILQIPHDTVLISEDCTGDGYEFENRYFVAKNGFIWKSEQWIGDNPMQLIIEIVEPLD